MRWGQHNRSGLLSLYEGQRASLCLCSVVLICHCRDSAGIQHPVQHSIPPGLASGEPADERIWVQGKGVYFLPLKRSVWKVSRIKLHVEKYFPFLALVRLIFSEGCEQKFTVQGLSVPLRLTVAVASCPGRDLHNCLFQNRFF